MSSVEHFQANSPHIIHEIIDGEVVLVNLENGSYYSIDKVGATIWNLIEEGAAVSQIVETITGQYAGDQAEIENGVHDLLNQLQREKLIVPDERPGVNGHAGPGLSAANGHPNKPAFETPTLHKYTDMEDLLLLDPIHDVDETGWPNTNPNSVADA